MNVSDVREYFKGELAAGRFTEDKTGAKTIEMIGASFIADESSIFGTPNQEYINKELEWYESQSTNIYDISGDGTAPAAWKYAADEHGNINSNYGKLIFLNNTMISIIQHYLSFSLIEILVELQWFIIVHLFGQNMDKMVNQILFVPML